MKNFDDWFVFIILVVFLIIAAVCSIGIANSDLPAWVKFALLNR